MAMLSLFLESATDDWDDRESIKFFELQEGEVLSCIKWKGQFFITGTDILRIIIHRTECFGRKIFLHKKFEEGVFSDLRNLKPGQGSVLEEPRSAFLQFLHENGCIRTQKKQKVFRWEYVDHDKLFIDSLERDLKRERLGQASTTICVNEPALGFVYSSERTLRDEVFEALERNEANVARESNHDDEKAAIEHEDFLDRAASCQHAQPSKRIFNMTSYLKVHQGRKMSKKHTHQSHKNRYRRRHSRRSTTEVIIRRSRPLRISISSDSEYDNSAWGTRSRHSQYGDDTSDLSEAETPSTRKLYGNCGLHSLDDDEKESHQWDLAQADRESSNEDHMLEPIVEGRIVIYNDQGAMDCSMHLTRSPGELMHAHEAERRALELYEAWPELENTYSTSTSLSIDGDPALRMHGLARSDLDTFSPTSSFFSESDREDTGSPSPSTPCPMTPQQAPRRKWTQHLLSPLETIGTYTSSASPSPIRSPLLRPESPVFLTESLFAQ